MTAEPDRSALAPLTHRNTWRHHADGSAVDWRRPDPAGRPVTVPAEPATVTFHTGTTAVLVVDMQNDFCSSGGWLASIGVDVSALDPVRRQLARLLPAARAAGLPVVWLNWGNRADRANLPPGVARVYDPTGAGRGIGATMPGGSRVLTRGDWGAAVVPDLPTDPADVWVDKYRMSGFWDTELDTVLRNLRVDSLLFTGVNSDQCVYATLIDAACAGYDTLLVTDAAGTTSPDYCHAATVYNVRQCFGFTATTDALLTALGAGGAGAGEGM